jgi:hypothetical protein
MVLSSFARCNCVLFHYLKFGGRLFSRNGHEVLETLYVSTNCVVCAVCEELGAVALIIGELVASSCVQLLLSCRFIVAMTVGLEGG